MEWAWFCPSYATLPILSNCPKNSWPHTIWGSPRIVLSSGALTASRSGPLSMDTWGWLRCRKSYPCLSKCIWKAIHSCLPRIGALSQEFATQLWTLGTRYNLYGPAMNRWHGLRLLDVSSFSLYHHSRSSLEMNAVSNLRQGTSALPYPFVHWHDTQFPTWVRLNFTLEDLALTLPEYPETWMHCPIETTWPASFAFRTMTTQQVDESAFHLRHILQK